MKINKQLINDQIWVLSIMDEVMKCDTDNILTECRLLIKLHKPLVIDLRQVIYITSSAWHALITIAKEYWLQYNSLLIIMGLPLKLLKIVKILSLDDCLNVVSDYDKALKIAQSTKLDLITVKKINTI